MSDNVVSFMRVKGIDSFQKLQFVLFLHQHQHIRASSRELAQRLYLGDMLLLERIINELRRTGLLDCADGCFKLHDDLEVKRGLEGLAKEFDDPLARQGLLNQVMPSPYSAYHLDAFELS